MWNIHKWNNIMAWYCVLHLYVPSYFLVFHIPFDNSNFISFVSMIILTFFFQVFYNLYYLVSIPLELLSFILIFFLNFIYSRLVVASTINCMTTQIALVGFSSMYHSFMNFHVDFFGKLYSTKTARIRNRPCMHLSNKFLKINPECSTEYHKYTFFNMYLFNVLPKSSLVSAFKSHWSQ